MIDSLTAFKDEAAQPESPYADLHPHATIMAMNRQAEDEIKRAVSLATKDDIKKPFTIEVQPDDLGITTVDGVQEATYRETLPNTNSLLILGDEGR